MPKINKITILITGARGFIGPHLTNYLKKKKKYKIINLPNKFYDLSDFKTFKTILVEYQPNIIIHLAARTRPTIRTKKEDRLQHKNTTLPVINLVNCVKYATRLKKIIFFGTIEEYGLAKPPFYEKQKTRPQSSYGIAKKKAFEYVKKNIDHKINYVWLRPSLVFGRINNKKRLIGSIMNGLKFNKKIKVTINGQIRDFLFIDDLCKFLNLLIKVKTNIKHNLLNVSAENFINLNNIFSYFPTKIQSKLKKIIINNPKKQHLNYYSSNRKFKKIFKNFKFTGFKRGLYLSFKSFNK